MPRISIQKKHCILIGEGSIARFSLELLKKNAFQVVACVTGDQELVSWASQREIPVIKWHGDDQLFQSIQKLSYNLLVSVGNLYPIPQDVLNHNNAIPINIHDGPMDSFLGFHTPMWALLNQKKHHEVCWHLMTAELYQGDLLARTTIDIEPDETAMTLNAKCFSTALASLSTILESITSEGIETLPSPHAKLDTIQYFSKKDRPSSLGYLSPSQTVENTLQLIRALDTGHSDNPLCLAKVILENTHYHVIAATSHELGAYSSSTLGAVIRVDQNVIVVRWSDGVLELELAPLLVTQANLELNSNLTKAIIRPSSTEANLADLSAHFGIWEPWWLGQLRDFSALSVPYIGSQDDVGTCFESQQLLITNSLEYSALLVAAYLSRLCDQSIFSIPVIFDTKYAGPAQIYTDADHYGAPRGSLSFAFDFATSAQNQLASFSKQWQKMISAGIFSVDLVKRNSSIMHWQAAVDQPYSLFISDEDDNNLRTRLACFTSYALAIVISPKLKTIRLVTHGGLIKPLSTIVDEIQHFTASAHETSSLGSLSLVTPSQQALLKEWSHGETTPVEQLLFDRLSQVFTEKSSEPALYHRTHTLTFQELDSQIRQVVSALATHQVQPGDFVGVMMPRCIELLPCLLGVMSFGATCVPMDPGYPTDRLEYVIENSQLNYLLCLDKNASLHANVNQLPWSDIAQCAVANHRPSIKGTDLAYMLYTSGSSGKPKGVMVEHRNLANFFVAMDKKVPLDNQSVWLAVTSISFDISLLEMLWTLSRGVSVVLYDGQDIQSSHEKEQTIETSPQQQAAHSTPLDSPESKMDFGLFFWNISSESDVPGPHQYELLLKASEYGDQNGFSSVWTPERHFGDFGGLYPNPAITSAAVAARTDRIHIRAGSCVFPLHHPVRIAEDWAIIDNISNGRIGLSAAPGWMPNDFVIMPDNHADAKGKMFENLELVRKLWRGEAVSFDGPTGPVDVVTLPRPVQKEIPIWITTGGNPENFSKAGTMGANLLTHLLGQTVEELEDKIKLYNNAWTAAGHPGQGCVTVMLHTFVADTREKARAITLEPMKNYLKTALFLVKAAAWDWPLFKKLSENQSQNLDDFFANISDEDLDALLEFAFDRYFKTSGLFGNQEDCIAFADKLYDIGVGEIGCLIDFGIETSTVLEHLPHLKAVLDEFNTPDRTPATELEVNAPFGVASLIEKHKVTHLQVTPSMARLFLSDPGITTAMKQLQTVLVGGEALPLDLAKTLKSLISGPLLNMYGPTETTIWSSVDTMDATPDTISLGRAVANTQLTIVDSRRQPMPIGAIGELMIGGQGVVRGYWQRQDLTDEKFIQGLPEYTSAERVYSTGDLARYLPDGRLLFLGRNDFQVKVRGYRIELEEIETIVLQQPGIAEAVVHPVVYSGAEPRLVGYFTTKTTTGSPPSAASLKEALSQVLPPFMVPNAFVHLQTFPLTPNAKIDRKALPLPTALSDSTQSLSDTSLDNASDLEKKVLDIWRDILGSPSFGLNDNFFDHGGHSLLVVDVMTRVRPLFEKQIKLIDLFRYPKVAQLVEYLSEENNAEEAAVITSAQKRAAARRAARRR